MIDLDAIREKYLKQCGACDAGLPQDCVCPAEFRPILAELVEEVQWLRNRSEHPGALRYQSLADGWIWEFTDAQCSAKSVNLLSATDLDVLNLWRQSVAVSSAATAEMDRRGFPLPVRVEVRDAP